MLTEWLNTYGKDRLKETSYSRTFLDMVDKGSVHITPQHVINAVYHKLRIADYPLSPHASADIEARTAEEVRGMKVDTRMPEWHYRVPEKNPTRSNGVKAQERISLNVHADSALIEKLDHFCTQHGGYYKTPSMRDNWYARHEPVTVYFYQPVTPEMERQIVEIATPHVRGHNLLGRTVAHGVAIEASPSLADIQALIRRGETLHPQLGQDIRKMATYKNGTPTPDLKLSTGEVRATEMVLDDYERHMAAHPELKSVPISHPATPPAHTSSTPVHSSGSSSSKAAKDLSKAAEGGKGKTAWIVGGVAAAVVAIGAFIAVNKKKSHTEQEMDRRTETPPAQVQAQI